MELTLTDLQNDYVRLVNLVMEEGRYADARGHGTSELTNVTLIFDDPGGPMLPVLTGRKINLKLAAVETLDMIAGTSHPKLVMAAAPEYSRVLVDPSDLDYGAYGPRLADQLQRCVTALRADPSTRQAVAMIWRPDDLIHEGDRPCTIFMQFLLREGKLELHATMRSNDVWLGTPYDVFAFTQIQHTVAYALDVPAGRYVHHATSLHLYARDVARAAALHGVDSDAETLTRDSLPRGVRPRDKVKHPVERHNFTGLQNTAYMMLEAAAFGPPPDMPFTTDSLDANPWYAQQLAKLVRPKEDVK